MNERMVGADRGELATPAVVEDPDMAFFRRLQLEVGAWSQKNFGEQGAYRPLLGIFEELSELWSAMETGLRSEALDAIGDITIYMADYFHRRGWRMDVVWDRRARDENGRSSPQMVFLIGRLAHSHLKGEQGIRGKAEKHDRTVQAMLGRVLQLADGCSRLLGADYIEIVKEVWSKVSKRNWVENPDTAHEVVEAAATPEGT